MKQLYDLRSMVEHLHDPLSSIDGATHREKVIALFQKSFEAEVIARYCLERFLSNQGVWSHFEDDSTLEQFWQLEKTEREKIWGATLDIPGSPRNFVLISSDPSISVFHKLKCFTEVASYVQGQFGACFILLKG